MDRSLALAAAIASASPMLAHALPNGGEVAAGAGTVQKSGSSMTVTQATPNLSVNWQSFGIAQGESVRFVQPGSSSIALNRVLGSDASAIYGSLQANGQVFLLNPNGILFGRSAQVNVGGLVASTLNLSDADFMAGKRSFSGSGGSVVNQGSLTSPGGYVALLGGNVSNEGTIAARLGSVALAGAQRVTLDFKGDRLLSLQVDEKALAAAVKNSGVVQADGGTVLMTAGAKDALLDTVINNQGIVRAQTVENRAGRIVLLGGDEGEVRVAGTLDASAPNGGNGGFIETSGAKVAVADAANITTAAPYGRNGTWLIDPQDFVVGKGGDITGAALSTQLASTNVSLTSSSGARAGNGDLLVNDTVAWKSNNQLTLTAERNIGINAPIIASGTSAGLTLNPSTGGSGGYFFGALGRVDLSGASAHLSIAGQNYTLIRDVNGLQAMNSSLGGHYALARDIDASATSSWNGGAGFQPVGTLAGPFTGRLEGLNHSISGLVINRPSTTGVGVFTYVSGATLSNFGRTGGTTNASGSAGGITGIASNSLLTNLSNSGPVSAGGSVGGLVGELANSTLGDSRNSGAVTGTITTIGGLVGDNFHGTVTHSVATGAVSGAINTGGLVGFNRGMITQSHATGAVTGTNNVGGLAGMSTNGTVSDSYSTGRVSAGSSAVATGGLVGFVNGGSVSRSFSTGSVSGTTGVGGLVGINTSGQLSEDFASGDVTGTTGVGGLVGANTRDVLGDLPFGGSIADSYARGAVSGTNAVGGLVGLNNNGGTIRRTYSTGRVNGTDNVGGLVGANLSGNVSDSFWDTQTSGRSTSAGGIGLTTAQMKTRANFTSATAANGNVNPGWDFTNTWTMIDGVTYPLLRNTVGIVSPVVIRWKVADAIAARGMVPEPGTATLIGVAPGDQVYPIVALFRGNRQVTADSDIGNGAYQEVVIGLAGPDAGKYTLATTGNDSGRLQVLPPQAVANRLR